MCPGGAVKNVLGFLGGMIVLFIVFDALLMAWQLTPITAVSKYRHVKNLRWHRQDLVGHFSEEIPPEAKNAVFYYRAGFLQGGSSIELRIHMPEEFVEEVFATYQPQAKSIFGGAERTEKEPDGPDGPPKATFFTFPLDQQQTPREGPLLPQDFETLLLSPHPYHWNHGEASGISISRKGGEIIYWAEDW